MDSWVEAAREAEVPEDEGFFVEVELIDRRTATITSDGVARFQIPSRG